MSPRFSDNGPECTCVCLKSVPEGSALKVRDNLELQMQSSMPAELRLIWVCFGCRARKKASHAPSFASARSPRRPVHVLTRHPVFAHLVTHPIMLSRRLHIIATSTTAQQYLLPTHLPCSNTPLQSKTKSCSENFRNVASGRDGRCEDAVRRRDDRGSGARLCGGGCAPGPLPCPIIR